MSLFEEALQEMQLNILAELEQRIWERLEPRIQQELRARHMSISEAADYLHVSEQTVRRMVTAKEIPSFRVRNQIFIRQLDVDDWIAGQVTGRGDAVQGSQMTNSRGLGGAHESSFYKNK